MYIQSSYLRTVFNPHVYPRTIAKVHRAAKILQEKHGFDTIAFSGMSGAAVAFTLSHLMNISLMCVRKEKDGSHFLDLKSSYLEGDLDMKRYIILDDFIASGNTVRRIINSIAHEIPKAVCVGMVMYTVATDTTWYHSNYDIHIDVIGAHPDGTGEECDCPTCNCVGMP